MSNEKTAGQTSRLTPQVVNLAEVSRFYGANPEYVVAGGGNTSFKDDELLYIKPSGISLGSIKPEDFVKMNRASLSAIWKKDYPADADAREAEVLADMMASRCAGETNRPSVETLLHDLLPFSYVVHTHPALVNGLTCSVEGEKAAKRLFPESVWIPLINPGYILSKTVKDALDAFYKNTGNAPETSLIIFLQNHGIFVAANTIEEIDKVYKKVMGTLNDNVKKIPDFGNENTDPGITGKKIVETAKKIKPDNDWFVKFVCNKQIAAFTANRKAFEPVSSAFTPDHIVYSGCSPLYIEDKSRVEEAFKARAEKTGVPKIIAVQGSGIFSLCNSEKAVVNAIDAFKDTVKIAVYTESFGGPQFMSDEMIDFINNWEVERYRSQAIMK